MNEIFRSARISQLPTPNSLSKDLEGSNHRDKTRRVQMPVKMFPHLKLLGSLFMGPTLGFNTKQRNSVLNQIWCFCTIKETL